MSRQELTVEGRAPHNASNLTRKSEATVVQLRPNDRRRSIMAKRSARPRFLDGSATMEALLKTQDATCPRCDVETKIRHRPFSAQALAALIVWNEVAERLVGEAICDSCYDELREILIERNEEIHNPKPDKVETRKVPQAPAAEKTATKAAPAVAAKTAPAAKSASAAKTVAKSAPKTTIAKKAAKPSKEKSKEKEKAAPGRGKKVRKVS